MTELKKTTKRGKYYIEKYFNSEYGSVTEYYTNPSTNKIRIEYNIMSRMRELDCYDYRVIGGNCQCFQCGYRSRDGEYLYIETYAATYKIGLK